MKRGAFLYPLSPMPAWAERLFPGETDFLRFCVTFCAAARLIGERERRETEMTDLIKRSKKGDKEAFALLMDMHR